MNNKISIIVPVICISIITSIILLNCSSKEETQNDNDNIIAIIDNRKITKQDFLRRAEYTPRPNYCRLDNPIHKKIVLNSLIAEKLLALNSGKHLYNDSSFNSYIKGRIEQSMRQLLYYEKAFNNVELEEKYIQQIYKLSQRSYKLKITTRNIPTTSRGDSIFTSKISWTDQQIPELHNKLFLNDIKKGHKIDSIFMEDGTEISITVEEWTNNIDISESGIEKRKRDVLDYLKNQEAQKLYIAVVSDIMKGKELIFYDDVFYPFAEKAMKLYLNTEKDKIGTLNKALWNMSLELNESYPADNDFDLMSKPILNIDNQDWTVSDILNLIKSHPLVFRKRTMGKSEFPQQFHFALVDLIRDHYITKYAYEIELEKSESVVLNKELWEDYFLAQSFRDSLLHLYNKNINDTNDQYLIFESILNPAIDTLQNRYSDKIHINVELFDEIDLTKVDMMVTQRNVPYPVLVPNFPILTNDHKLDYGKKIN